MQITKRAAGLDRTSGERAFWLRLHCEKADSLVVLEESEPDFSNGIMHGHWTFFCPDGRRERRSMQVKMYLPHELQSMIEQCGFEQVRLFGNVTSAPLSLETPRCILVGQKPHAS